MMPVIRADINIFGNGFGNHSKDIVLRLVKA